MVLADLAVWYGSACELVRVAQHAERLKPRSRASNWTRLDIELCPSPGAFHGRDALDVAGEPCIQPCISACLSCPFGFQNSKYSVYRVGNSNDPFFTPPGRVRGRDGKLYPARLTPRKLRTDAALYRRRAAGESLRALADDYGVHPTTLWKHFRKLERA